MIRKLHPAAGIAAFLTILCFWGSTVVVELGGDGTRIAAVKLAILWGLAVLIPAIAVAGATGARLAGRSRQPVAAGKLRRMRFIALNGIAVLVPCAVVLQQRAGMGLYDRTFALVQAAELVAGAVNLALIGLSIRDGFKLTRRFGLSATAR
ncbi:hypothetical protein RA307_29065 [Xanthobacteraceae bacterium Astr-EGSB]|uniref:hypothetical protein n=1 Tax=Astrobacterium formosum TaxID=3069710 RepID=UPI0027B72886|nr:hypothetical protein [Xanthobacteraceae bacterium Astr-EGSB]